jgi:hypothetical protein
MFALRSFLRDDRLLLCHPVDAERERCCDNGGQPLRDRFKKIESASTIDKDWSGGFEIEPLRKTASSKN